MQYLEMAPPPPLRALAASLWVFEVLPGDPEQLQAIPLTGGVILGMKLGGGPVICFGPRLEPLHSVVRGGDRFAGVHLWPGVHRAWLGREAPALREVVRPLASLADPQWAGRVGAALEAAARQAWAAGGLEDLGQVLLEPTSSSPLDQAVLAAVLGILKADGRDPVGGLAGALGLSPATFRRRFRREVELSPKELARIRRVRASAADGVAGGQWAGIAAERGFADQAHLIREFQDLLGHPPEAFRARGQRIQHRLLET